MKLEEAHSELYAANLTFRNFLTAKLEELGVPKSRFQQLGDITTVRKFYDHGESTLYTRVWRRRRPDEAGDLLVYEVPWLWTTENWFDLGEIERHAETAARLWALLL